MVRGQNPWLGYFDNEVEGTRAYDRAAVEAFGEFARVNFPREWPAQRRAQVHAQWLEATKKERKKAERTGGKKRTPGGKRRSETTKRAKTGQGRGRSR